MPSLVAVEVDQLLLTRGGVDVELVFLRDLTTSYDILHPSLAHFERARAIIEQYRDLELGLVDAIVMAIAEDRRCNRILGVDQRNFMAVSPLHIDHFELIGMIR